MISLFPSFPKYNYIMCVCACVYMSNRTLAGLSDETDSPLQHADEP